MTPVTLRPAQKEDLCAVTELYRVVVAHMQAGGLMQWDDSYPNREVLAQDIEKGHLFLLTQGAEIMGSLAVNASCDDDYVLGNWSVPDGDFRAIHRLCVHPAHHGKGLAKQAIALAENLAKEAGCACIRLDTFSGNRAALALYAGLGYTRVGEMHWPLGTFILFEKIL